MQAAKLGLFFVLFFEQCKLGLLSNDRNVKD